MNALGKHEFAPILCTANLSSAQLLLERNANVNAKDYKGYTPLHYATYRGNLEKARLLMQFGANPQVKNNFDETPIKTTFLGFSGADTFIERGFNFYLCLVKQKQKQDLARELLHETSPIDSSNITTITYLAFGICADTGDLNFLRTLYINTLYLRPKEVVGFDEDSSTPSPKNNDDRKES